ncbi:hypothetical protein STCU_11720 [Strigomonas culicis]|uniref:Uncharacterized protein n=1 Tax=Strigomonas culicis TaxID=28005 RepID=S9UMB6_9TRYP|nr:hypothetical protein STCU_11720 [Strigomonas culicis]|eukprot:EPY15851.1 hypothetical protein STCU_11720 [Strigomonas culicis]
MYESILFFFRLRFLISLFLMVFFVCTFILQINFFAESFSSLFSFVFSLASLPQRAGPATTRSLLSTMHHESQYNPYTAHAPDQGAVSAATSGFLHRTGTLLWLFSSYSYVVVPVYLSLLGLLAKGVWQSYEDYCTTGRRAAVAAAAVAERWQEVERQASTSHGPDHKV